MRWLLLLRLVFRGRSEDIKMSLNDTGKRRVLCANMWSIWNYGNPNERYQKFLLRGRPEFKSFIENILLYDEIYVPTQDYLSLTILLGVLGEHTINQLISSKTLKFVRVKGSFCYYGNGGGIQTTEVLSPKENGKKDAFCSDIEYAVDWAIKGLDESIKDKMLTQRIIDNSIEVNLESIQEMIKNETYEDVKSSVDLQDFFALSNSDLNRLNGINPNEVRTYGGKDADSWKGDEIDTYLLLNNTNLELKLMEISNCDDMGTSNPLGHLLKAKFARDKKLNEKKYNSLTVLREISNIPDFGEALLNKEMDFSDLIKLKMSNKGYEFREWFHNNCQGDTIEITKEYIKLFEEIPKTKLLSVRILRFLIATGLSFIPGTGGLIGTGASLVDSFFVDKWAKGNSPKFFIDALKKIEKKTESIEKEKTKGLHLHY